MSLSFSFVPPQYPTSIFPTHSTWFAECVIVTIKEKTPSFKKFRQTMRSQVARQEKSVFHPSRTPHEEFLFLLFYSKKEIVLKSLRSKRQCLSLSTFLRAYSPVYYYVHVFITVPLRERGFFSRIPFLSGKCLGRSLLISRRRWPFEKAAPPRAKHQFQSSQKQRR